jgi:hypothetical protein
MPHDNMQENATFWHRYARQKPACVGQRLDALERCRYQKPYE